MKTWWEVEAAMPTIKQLKIDPFFTSTIVRRPTRSEARDSMRVLKNNPFYESVYMYKITLIEEVDGVIKMTREHKR